MIEVEQTLFLERGQELDGKEGIACRLLVHQARQRGGTLRGRANGVRNQLCQAFTRQRRKGDLMHRRAGFADRVELPLQRMGGSDFVVSVRSDQQQVSHIRLGQKILDKLERCRVEPLQIVEEQGQWMCRPREDTDESPEDQVEPALRVLWRKKRDRGLFSDDVLQFRDEVYNQQP